MRFDEQVAALERAAESTRRLIADPHGFSSYDPHALLAYQEHVLRWAHCAPAGATLLGAPLQGWDGTPFSGRAPQGPQTMLVNPAYRSVVERKHGEPPVAQALRIWRANHPEAASD